MRTRFKKLTVALAALAAFAAGGAALASAADKGSPPAPPTQAQAGPADNQAASDAADTDNLQQGDQTAPDTAGPSQEEQATESSSDGPGGYADTSQNADTQQEGQH